MLCIAVFKAITGQHVKIFGFELNEPQKRVEALPSPGKIDSVVKIVHDTVHEQLASNTQKKSTHKINTHGTSHQVTKKNQSPVNQENVNADNQANVNSGTNFGIIGNNNSIIGNVKKHPSMQLIEQIELALPKKDESINVAAISTGAGSYDFAQELLQKLQDKGYTKIGVGVMQRAPAPPKGVSLDTSRGKKTIMVNID